MTNFRWGLSGWGAKETEHLPLSLHWTGKWCIRIRCRNETRWGGQGACIDKECEESSVLAAGVVSKAADVGFIDGVQEWTVSLDQMQQCGLKLASGQNSDLLLQRGSGQGRGDMAELLDTWQPSTGLCLSEHTWRKEHSGGNSCWNPLGGDDLKLQCSILTCCGGGLVWGWACNFTLSRSPKSRGQTWTEPGGVVGSKILLLLD